MLLPGHPQLAEQPFLIALFLPAVDRRTSGHGRTEDVIDLPAAKPPAGRRRIPKPRWISSGRRCARGDVRRGAGWSVRRAPVARQCSAKGNAAFAGHQDAEPVIVVFENTAQTSIIGTPKRRISISSRLPARTSPTPSPSSTRANPTISTCSPARTKASPTIPAPTPSARRTKAHS